MLCPVYCYNRIKQLKTLFFSTIIKHCSLPYLPVSLPPLLQSFNFTKWINLCKTSIHQSHGTRSFNIQFLQRKLELDQPYQNWSHINQSISNEKSFTLILERIRSPNFHIKNCSFQIVYFQSYFFIADFYFKIQLRLCFVN